LTVSGFRTSPQDLAVMSSGEASEIEMEEKLLFTLFSLLLNAGITL
jgi:hypothetical protein